MMNSAMNPQAIVEIENLSYFYPPSRRGAAPKMALNGISFSVARGEIFGLLGPNGGGKTTLFKILSTLLDPSAGTVRIGGKNVAGQAKEIRRLLGVAFQFPSLDRKLTAAENLKHHGHLYGLRGQELEHRIRQVLDRFGLRERAGDLVETLSGGLQRRVELAKSLLHCPALMLLDEPSTGLDPGARRDLWDFLKQLRARDGITVLMTTHLMEEAAGCDRLALLNRGEIVAIGTPDELTSDIGGDVLTIHARDPQWLLAQIRHRFQNHASIFNGTIRIERQSGHRFIPQLVEAFPGHILSVSLGKPTLEDVFIRRTGHKLWEDGRP